MMNMPQSIGELWKSDNEQVWCDALARYWENSTVQRNLDIEKFMDKLDPESIRKLDSENWVAFLRLYFQWKFTGVYVGKRLADLESNEPDRLFRIKGLLFEPESSTVRKGLERA